MKVYGSVERFIDRRNTSVPLALLAEDMVVKNGILEAFCKQ